MTDKHWLSAKVIPGKQIGRTLGFPTINLDQPDLMAAKKEGVYACLVEIDKKIYRGLLYFGPRLILKEQENILEIFLFGFDREIYNKTIKFQPKDFIREVINFANFDDFRKQLELDSSRAAEILLK